MESSKLKFGEDYQDTFDPKAYLSLYYPSPDEVTGLMKFALQAIQQIYSEGRVKGDRLIEIGSGPTIHMLIPAAKWFNEIYITDFSKINRDTLAKWLARDPESFDWQPFFRYFAEKDGNTETGPQYEALLRDKVKGVLVCDYHQSNPLHPETMGQFDAVSSSLALEASCKDLEQYRKAMKNMISLVAPGGYFILFAILKCHFYVCGDKRFFSLYLTYEDVLDSLKEVGLQVVQVIDGDYKDDGDIAPFDHALMVLGKKPDA